MIGNWRRPPRAAARDGRVLVIGHVASRTPVARSQPTTADALRRSPAEVTYLNIFEKAWGRIDFQRRIFLVVALAWRAKWTISAGRPRSTYVFTPAPGLSTTTASLRFGGREVHARSAVGPPKTTPKRRRAKVA